MVCYTWRMSQPKALPHVVIVGGGFGGLTCAQALAEAPVRITLLDRSNHHLFQPLLYQVAMAGLSPAEIAAPIRSVLRHQDNVQVLLAEVTSVDLADNRLTIAGDGTGDNANVELAYDYLVLATGGQTSYFGHEAWARHAPGLKSIDDALEIRRRVLTAFELAERESDPARRKELLTFVVVGGGPTGVELAGAIGELARFVLARDFRAIAPGSAEILLLEGGPRILAAFDARLSAQAVLQLADLGVEVRAGARVTGLDAHGVHVDDRDAHGAPRSAYLRAATIIWGAGVRATDLTASLGVPLDASGRVRLTPTLHIPGYANAFAIGDMARFEQDGAPLPGVSPVAMQMGRLVAANINHAMVGAPPETFVYRDKGSMATIGRNRAVAQIGQRTMSGSIAWLAWLAVHLFFLIGFRNRVAALLNWFWSYVTYQRGARLITGTREPNADTNRQADATSPGTRPDQNAGLDRPGYGRQA